MKSIRVIVGLGIAVLILMPISSLLLLNQHPEIKKRVKLAQDIKIIFNLKNVFIKKCFLSKKESKTSQDKQQKNKKFLQKNKKFYYIIKVEFLPDYSPPNYKEFFQSVASYIWSNISPSPFKIEFHFKNKKKNNKDSVITLFE